MIKWATEELHSMVSFTPELNKIYLGVICVAKLYWQERKWEKLQASKSKRYYLWEKGKTVHIAFKS